MEPFRPPQPLLPVADRGWPDGARRDPGGAKVEDETDAPGGACYRDLWRSRSSSMWSGLDQASVRGNVRVCRSWSNGFPGKNSHTGLSLRVIDSHRITPPPPFPQAGTPHHQNPPIRPSPNRAAPSGTPTWPITNWTRPRARPGPPTGQPTTQVTQGPRPWPILLGGFAP